MYKASSKTVRHDGGVEERHNRYSTGLVEISYYVPPVIKSAMPILAAVVSRQGPTLAWNAYLATDSGQEHRRSLTKRNMTRAALEHAQRLAAQHRERFGAAC